MYMLLYLPHLLVLLEGEVLYMYPYLLVLLDRERGDAHVLVLATFVGSA